MDNELLSKHPPSKIMNRLKRCLAGAEALNLEGLVHHAGLDQHFVVQALARLVELQEVEMLCPVTANSCHDNMALHPLVHYRLVRARDRDFLWEVELAEKQRAVSVPVHEWDIENHQMPEREFDLGWLWPKRHIAFSAG